MDIVQISEARRFSRDRANRLGLLDRPRLVCDLICLEPGQHEPRRDYPTSDELYYVIEGKAKVRAGLHEYDLEAEQALLVPPNLQHWIANPGPGRLTALAIVTPKPGREAEIRPTSPRRGPATGRGSPAARGQERRAPGQGSRPEQGGRTTPGSADRRGRPGTPGGARTGGGAARSRGRRPPGAGRTRPPGPGGRGGPSSRRPRRPPRA